MNKTSELEQTYPYVGPKSIADRLRLAHAGLRIESPNDVRRWMTQTNQETTTSGQVTATFVIDESGWLRIADRRSEHFACAGGLPVRSAGEMTFQVAPREVSVVGVTNQSTGYCPPPESWPAVQQALKLAGLECPPGFDQEFTFRRCESCQAINIVKDGNFACAVCGKLLPKHWNFTRDQMGELIPALAFESNANTVRS